MAWGINILWLSANGGLISGVLQCTVGRAQLLRGLKPAARVVTTCLWGVTLRLGVAGGMREADSSPAYPHSSTVHFSKQLDEYAPRVAWCRHCTVIFFSFGRIAIACLSPTHKVSPMTLRKTCDPAATLRFFWGGGTFVLVCAARRSQRRAPYSVLIHIDLRFMLSHRVERSTAGHGAAWRGLPRRCLACLCRPAFVYVWTRLPGRSR